MIGAGVFTTSGFTLADLGDRWLVVAAWAVGGVVAFAGAMSYGQLVRAMPESGGEYVFLSRALHPMVGFVAGWVSLIAGFTGAIAFAATALESYVLPGDTRPAWLPEDAVAASVVLAGGLLHGARRAVGAQVQNVAVGLKLALLIGFLAIATVPTFGRGVAPMAASLEGWPLIAAFATSLVWISLSYSGFNAAVYVVEEAESPDDVSRALWIGTAIVAALYIALNAIFVLAPPVDLIAGRADIAAVSAGWLAGETVASTVRAIIAVALFTSVSSMMMAAPRVYAKMAEDGLLPGWLGVTGGVPRMAVGVQVALALILVFVTSLRDLLSYLGLTLSLSAACSVACLFLPSIRRRLPLGGSILPPAIYVGFTLVAATVLAIESPRQIVATVATFAAGALIYGMIARRGVETR